MIKKSTIAALLFLFVAHFIEAQTQKLTAVPNSPFPLKIHSNGKHITDQDGKPFLMVADVAWQMLRKLSHGEAVQYMDIRKSQSFNTFIIQLLPALPNQKNFQVAAPFHNNNLNQPNKAYFNSVEKIVKSAAERNLVVGIVVSRKSWNTIFDEHKEGDWKAYGEFLGNTFAKYSNIIWIISEEEYHIASQYKFIAEGLNNTTEGNLIASLTTCAPTIPIDSTSNESDLKFVIPDSTVTFSEYANLANWQKNSGKLSVQPFLIANSEFPKELKDQSVLIRNQAYQSIMSSAAGFCHMSTIKNFHPTWRKNITRDGAEYIHHLVKILKGIPWEYMYPNAAPTGLIPDSTDQHQIGVFALSNNRLAMLYIPESKSVTLNLSKLKGDKFRCVWYSPRTGKRWLGDANLPARNATVAPPDPQPGWDWILLVGAQQ